MQLFFNFGEKTPEFDFKVINEREARASAGIMFLLGLLSLFSVYLFRTLLWAELFSMTFIFEFFMRMFINPKYAPYMLLSSLIVGNQKPEWVEAKPKRFAWGLGMLLGVIMTYYLVFDIISLVRLGICLLCLVLLFVESAFGICLGCLLYHRLNITLKRCPGGVCETDLAKRKVNYRYIVLALFATLFVLTYLGLQEYKYTPTHKVVIIED